MQEIGYRLDNMPKIRIFAFPRIYIVIGKKGKSNMAKDNKGLTPMMRQFFSMKEKHPDALMLFRCGDFYETYCDDAIEASKILGITLTRRK